MKKQVLFIKGINLESGKKIVLKLKASNPFMLGLKYAKSVAGIYRDAIIAGIFVEEWHLENAQGVGGNKGLNAGAYLCEQMEELSGLNLS